MNNRLLQKCSQNLKLQKDYGVNGTDCKFRMEFCVAYSLIAEVKQPSYRPSFHTIYETKPLRTVTLEWQEAILVRKRQSIRSNAAFIGPPGGQTPLATAGAAPNVAHTIEDNYRERLHYSPLSPALHSKDCPLI